MQIQPPLCFKTSFSLFYRPPLPINHIFSFLINPISLIVNFRFPKTFGCFCYTDLCPSQDLADLLMSSNARGILMPGASRKRKKREPSDGVTSQKPIVKSTEVSGSYWAAAPPLKPLFSNRLIAGYMACEFLSKGTLLGQKFDPARLEVDAKNKKVESRSQPSGKLEPTTYAEVANMLKSDGVYIPGVVNPTQLASWIQL